MKLITHPSNKEFIEQLSVSTEFRSAREAEDFANGIHRFKWNIKIVFDSMMEPEEWTGRWLVLQDRFSTYWDGVGEPPSWCIYFGFVKKEMKKKFWLIDESKMNKPKVWSPKFWDKSFSIPKPKYSVLNTFS